MTMIKYKSIGQFRNAIKHITEKTYFQGIDENGEIIYDKNKQLPVVSFHGTCKLHGSNGGCSLQNNELVILSRKNILTPEKDNAGFASFCYKNKEIFKQFFNDIISEYNIDTEKNNITIYGEWAGEGIQRGVGISKMPKSYFIFGIKISPKDENDSSFWVDFAFKKQNKIVIESVENNIYNIESFKTWDIDIDLNNPKLSQNVIFDLVQEVENRCPVASYFLPDEDELIGEGIVWIGTYKNQNFTFKSKGEKHSKSRVKTIKKLTPEELEKLSKIDKCVEEIFSIQRCNQALTEVIGIDFEKNIEMKHIGKYLKWISQDTIKEELDIIIQYNLIPKDVIKKVQNKAKKYFIDIHDKIFYRYINK